MCSPRYSTHVFFGRACNVVKPADFAENTVAVDPVRAYEAVVQIASRSGARWPRMTEQQILHLLVERYAMRGAVDLLR